MSSTNANAVTPTMARSLARNVSLMASSSHRDGLRAVETGVGGDVADGALVLEYVLDDIVVGVELGGRDVAAREDLLLPVALDGFDRALEHLLGESTSNGRGG